MTPSPTRALPHALPGRWVDLARDGVPEREWHGHGHGHGQVAVYNALLRIAMSAIQRGWGRAEWQEFVTQRQNRLAVQLWTGKQGKLRTQAAVLKTLAAAWTAAEGEVAKLPPAWSRDEVAELARERAEAALRLAEDPDAALDAGERGVLAAVAWEVRRRELLRVAISRLTFEALTGLGEKAVRCAVERLVERGVIVRVAKGRPASPGSPRARAALYSLPTRIAALPFVPTQRRGGVELSPEDEKSMAILAELAALDAYEG